MCRRKSRAHHEYNRWKVVTRPPPERDIADRTVASKGFAGGRETNLQTDSEPPTGANRNGGCASVPPLSRRRRRSHATFASLPRVAGAFMSSVRVTREASGARERRAMLRAAIRAASIDVERNPGKTQPWNDSAMTVAFCELRHLATTA